jgi:hypothetical protein
MLSSDAKMQRFWLWVAVGGYVFACIGLVPLTRLVPPISPSLGEDAIAAFWAEDVQMKLLGLVICFLGMGMALGFFIVIFLQMKRVEGRSAPLAWMQVAAGLLTVAQGLVMYLLWLANAFRPDRGASVMLAYNDVSWFGFFVPYLFFVQVIPIALAAFKDTDRRVFPRWVGYFNLWVAVTGIPAIFMPFFKTGPIAWDGLLTFWVFFVIYGSWVTIMFYVMFKATRSLEEEDQALDAQERADRETLDAMAAFLAQAERAEPRLTAGRIDD